MSLMEICSTILIYLINIHSFIHFYLYGHPSHKIDGPQTRFRNYDTNNSGKPNSTYLKPKMATKGIISRLTKSHMGSIKYLIPAKFQALTNSHIFVTFWKARQVVSPLILGCKVFQRTSIATEKTPFLSPTRCIL